jgi:adenylate kinase
VGFILDGYPRTVAQVGRLDRLLGARSAEVDHVFLLAANVGIILDRLAGRAGQGRADDEVAIVRARLAIYTEQTEPIARGYEERGLLRRVDASSGVKQVAASIVRTFEAKSDLT